MTLNKLYIDKIIESNKYNDNHYIKTRKKIEDLEKKFEKVTLYKRFVYEQQPKYYLQNKIKKDTDDIQEGLREEIERLNYTYEDNFYFINIDKDILSKKENKHIYNIFKVNIIEYVNINLLDDIIKESDFLFNDSNIMKPLTFSNLNDDLKLILYDIIDETINLKEIYTDYDEINMFKYNTRYFEYLKDTIYEFFIDIYSDKISDVNEIKNLLIKMDSSLSCCTSIPIYETLNINYKKGIYLKEINRIIDLIINQGWSIDMNLLNQDILLEIYNKGKE